MRHVAAVACIYSLFVLMTGRRVAERLGRSYLSRNLTPSPTRHP